MKNNYTESIKKIYRRIMNFFMLILLTGIFVIRWYSELNVLMNKRFENKGNLLTILLYIIILILFMQIWGGFKLGHQKLVSLISSQVFAVICTNMIISVQVILMVGTVSDCGKIIASMAAITLIHVVICFFWSVLAINVFVRLFPPYRILQINGNYRNHLKMKIQDRDDKYQICEEISIHESQQKIFERMKKYDAVLLNDIPSEQKNDILKYCFENDVRVYFTPKISDIIVKGTDEINLFDTPIFLCKNIGLSIEERIVKRVMDVFISGIVLILTSPIMLVTAIAIKCEDGGPIFFKQKRCTQGGQEFWIYKFRSMIVNAEKDGKSRPATDNDDRITKVGAFIRKTRIDELPQLYNILKGDMSFVGPRPERIEHIEKYCREIPEFSYRLKVKGGLTGYAQVYGRYNTTAYDKLKMDLIYIVNYSLLLDIQIILETIKIIFRKESTQGFSEEQVKDIRKN